MPKRTTSLFGRITLCKVSRHFGLTTDQGNTTHAPFCLVWYYYYECLLSDYNNLYPIIFISYG